MEKFIKTQQLTESEYKDVKLRGGIETLKHHFQKFILKGSKKLCLSHIKANGQHENQYEHYIFRKYKNIFYLFFGNN